MFYIWGLTYSQGERWRYDVLDMGFNIISGGEMEVYEMQEIIRCFVYILLCVQTTRPTAKRQSAAYLIARSGPTRDTNGHLTAPTSSRSTGTAPFDAPHTHKHTHTHTHHGTFVVPFHTHTF